MSTEASKDTAVTNSGAPGAFSDIEDKKVNNLPPNGPASNQAIVGKIASVLKEVAATAVIFLFVLYCIGFVIINSHLARFGIQAPTLPALDYVAASLCYALFVSVIGFPAWILIYSLMEGIIKKQRISGWIFVVVIIWNVLIGQFTSLFFGDNNTPVSTHWFNTFVIIVGFIHLATVMILKKFKRLPARLEVLDDYSWGFGYIALMNIVGFMRRPEVDGLFVLSALTFYLTFTNLPIYHIQDAHEHLRRREAQIMIGLFAICLSLANASQFGRKQFGLLPHSIGGGKLSKVLLKTSLAISDSPQSFDLPVKGDCFGPVMLLYQSEIDVAVISEDNFNADLRSSVQIRRNLIDAIITLPVFSPKASSTPAPETPKPSISAPSTPATKAPQPVILSQPPASLGPKSSKPSSTGAMP